MKAMSAAERNEFHQLIGHKFTLETDGIEAAHPEWERKLDDRLQKIAIGRLKVEKDVAELERLEQQEQEIADRKAEVESRIARKMPFENSTRRHRGTCRTRMSLCDVIADIKSKLMTPEKRKCPAGKQAIAADEAATRRRATLAGCSTRADVAASGLLKEL